MKSSTIQYSPGQVLGSYGCKFLREGKQIPRQNSEGRPYLERHAFFECGLCGIEFSAHIGKVKSNWTKSCGCKKLTSDGISILPSGDRDPLHIVWSHMNKRCTQSNAVNWGNYGGRGIRVCNEWASSFSAFRSWAISAGWKKGLQIDRIDNDGHYCPENCRFVTNKQNSNNKRTNRRCYFQGEKLTFSEASERLNVSTETLRVWSKNPGANTRKRPPGLTFED